MKTTIQIPTALMLVVCLMAIAALMYMKMQQYAAVTGACATIIHAFLPRLLASKSHVTLKISDSDPPTSPKS